MHIHGSILTQTPFPSRLIRFTLASLSQARLFNGFLIAYAWRHFLCSSWRYLHGGGGSVASVVSDSLRPHGLLCTRDSPGKSTGMGWHVRVDVWNKVLTYFCDLHKNLRHQGSCFIVMKTDSDAFWILLPSFDYGECGLLCNPLSEKRKKFFFFWMQACQSVCLTLFNPKDCSPPGSSVHGIL